MNPRFVWLLVLAFLLTACGDDPDPEVEIPSWAKVAPEQIAEAAKHAVPVAFENDLGMRFVLIPAGTFLMGSPEDEKWRDDDETQHEVTISKPFYMQITEVTNGQFNLFEPEHRTGEYEGHSLDDAMQPAAKLKLASARAFVNWMSSRDPGRAYALPTEASWEYACRAGTAARFWWGDSADEGVRCANIAVQGVPTLSPFESIEELIEEGIVFPGDDDGHVIAAPVASYPPNRWGLHDMLGNVWEWCSDVLVEYGSNARLMRGGSWFEGPCDVRCAYRYVVHDTQTFDTLGFRLVSPLPEPGSASAE